MMSSFLGIIPSPFKKTKAAHGVGATPTTENSDECSSPPAPELPPYTVSSSLSSSSNGSYDVDTSPRLAQTPGNDIQGDIAQWYKRQWKTCKQDNARLRTLLDSRPPVSSMSGRGKNKMTLFNMPHEDVSNTVQLRNLTTAFIWPTNKFLFFQGAWTVYNAKTPHPFAKYVMDAVQLSPELEGFENDYYRDVALPIVSAKLSNLRGNMITRCGVTFNSEYFFIMHNWICL